MRRPPAPRVCWARASSWRAPRGHGGGVVCSSYVVTADRSYVYPSSTSITGSSNSSAVMGHTSCSASRSGGSSGDSTVESLETSVSCFGGGGRDGGDAGLSPEGLFYFYFVATAFPTTWHCSEMTGTGSGRSCTVRADFRYYRTRLP